MAKKRVRGQGREPSRAELKAIERRATATSTLARAPEERAGAGALPDADGPAAGRRGVLPSRPSRVAAAPLTLSREQELTYIRHDLIRLVWIAAVILVLLIVLTFFLR